MKIHMVIAQGNERDEPEVFADTVRDEAIRKFVDQGMCVESSNIKKVIKAIKEAEKDLNNEIAVWKALNEYSVCRFDKVWFSSVEL